MKEFLAHYEVGDPSFTAGFHFSFEPVFDQEYFFPVPIQFHDGSGFENPDSLISDLLFLILILSH